MSIWTHVIGTIQCEPSTKDKLVAALGTPWKFGHLNETRFVGPHVPEGSEGSIQWTASHHGNSKWRVVGEGTVIAIEGDLRDYGDDIRDIKEVVDWFTHGCEALDARAGLLSISVEFGPQLVIKWDWDRKHSSIQQVTWTDFDTEYKELLEGKLKWDL